MEQTYKYVYRILGDINANIPGNSADPHVKSEIDFPMAKASSVQITIILADLNLHRFSMWMVHINIPMLNKLKKKSKARSRFGLIERKTYPFNDNKQSLLTSKVYNASSTPNKTRIAHANRFRKLAFLKLPRVPQEKRQAVAT